MIINTILAVVAHVVDTVKEDYKTILYLISFEYFIINIILINTGIIAVIIIHIIVTISDSDVTYGQVWWPILRIRALHLSHPKCTHTAVNTHTPWTHTRSSGQPLMLRRPGSSWGFGALSWYWRWRERCTFTPPTYNSCRTWDSNSQPLGYESDSLTIRPRLPHYFVSCSSSINSMHFIYIPFCTIVILIINDSILLTVSCEVLFV